jgi:ZIP family zinc transporter
MVKTALVAGTGVKGLPPLDAVSPVALALVAGLFTWTVTAFGAGAVFVAGTVSRRLLDAMLGFSGGVMIAASYWSLLAPCIEISVERSTPAWVPATVGFLLGGACLWGLDRTLPHLHLGFPREQAEGLPIALKSNVLLVLAITLHNIPEGLAVGVAFGGGHSVAAAVALTLGIGLQNIPEGVAVAMPIRAEGRSRLKAFWYGQLSAVVEPVAALVGAAAVVHAAPILPYALSFAAGAMVYVVVEELIPESHRAGNVDLATVCFMAGFVVMMVLDVTLG